MNVRSAISVAESEVVPHPFSLTETSLGLFSEIILADDWARYPLLGKALVPEEVESEFSSYRRSDVEVFSPQRVSFQIDELSAGLFTSNPELTAQCIFWGMAPDSSWTDLVVSNFRGRSVRARSEAGTYSEEDVSSHLKELLLLQVNTEELFVDGMDSSLSREVVSAIEAFGNAAVTAVEKIMDSGRANVEIVGELLRQLGYMEDIWTHQARRKVIACKLESPDPRIRDAASIGVSALDDPSLLKLVSRAFAQESSVLVKENMKLVMDQLQETQCSDFSG